ncbi:MAG: RNA methyltransferase [Gemmataceae bacterium]
MIAHCRIVLVRTHYAGNIGSTCRAMMNFGVHDLVLVDPIASVLDHDARRLAAGAGTILEAARVVPDLETAVADCGLVVGTSGSTAGTLRHTIRGTPAVLMPRIAESLVHGPVALVFGPEPHGLDNAELARCQALMHLPTDPEYTSLNLALSVGICLYELRNQHFPREPISRRPAPYADLERSFEHLEKALSDVRFLFGQNAEGLMFAFRHLVNRAQPTPQEVKMLHGLARQLEYIGRKLAEAEQRSTPAE